MRREKKDGKKGGDIEAASPVVYIEHSLTGRNARTIFCRGRSEDTVAQKKSYFAQ